MSSTPFRKIGANISWLLFDRVFRMVVGVVTLAVVARHLGTAEFGDLNFSINLVALLTSVAGMSLDGVVIRELVRRPEQSAHVLGSAAVLKIIGATLCILLVALIGWAEGGNSSTFPLAIIISMGFLPQAFDVTDLWFQRHLQSKFTVMAKSVALLIGAGTKIGLATHGAPIEMFAWAQAFDASLLSTALVVMYHRTGGTVLNWRASKEVIATLLRDSWPLILAGLLVGLYGRVEQFLVRSFLDSHSMGVYYASARITELWNFIPNLLLSTLYPLLLEKRMADHHAYLQWIQVTFDLLTSIGILVALGVTALAPFLIKAIYGDDYLPAVNILLIQAWFAPITFSGAVRAQVLLMEGSTVYHWWAAVIGIAGNLGLGLWLTPKLGAPGAAISALAGYIMSAYFTSLLFPKLRECGRMQTKAFLTVARLPQILREPGNQEILRKLLKRS